MNVNKINVNDFDEQHPDLFTHLDRQFADFIQELSGGNCSKLLLATRLLCNQTGKGNVCLDIPSIAEKNIIDVLCEDAEDKNGFILYKKDKWLNELSNISSVIGKPGEFKPLILDQQGRLFLYRYWQYENNLSNNIKKRLRSKPDNINLKLLKEGLNRLFPKPNDGKIDWQRIAAQTAVLRKFCVISGGPGTGKTSTVIKILALLLEQAERGDNIGQCLKIALVAPTGKAAARLSESIKEALEKLDCHEDLKQNIPHESFTIHRLLGSISGSPYFKFNRKNQLPYDIVVIDESSMADLALMAKLFDAAPLDSRLIILGDKDQLASVEAGAVFGDICNTGYKNGYSEEFKSNILNIDGEDITEENIIKNNSDINDSIIVLKKNYRFDDNTGIGALSRAVKDGNDNLALSLLKDGNYKDIRLTQHGLVQSLVSEISPQIINGYGEYLKESLPLDSLKLFSNFTILCATRKGPYGVEFINNIVEKILYKKGLINTKSKWYNGRPVMITRNDYRNNLFNGDIGIILNEVEGDNKPYCFISASDGTKRKIHPLKLPDHETVFAMTVHKSQGSEFNNVLLLLPDRQNPMLIRELFYTAITRARKSVNIWGSENILRYMITNPTIRNSGLRDSLWGV